ncbi:MAG: NUDIX hydrolase [Clostridia bacterium]|jgi:ADP-ribose pyrophosphatase|nr:NUDIX hydrolase [Clostridia bacterium]
MDMTERTVGKNYLYRGKILSLRCDDALLPDGTPCKREIVEHSGGAGVLCVREGKVLLVKQYRYAYGEELYEIPAGKLNEGEDPALTAARELKEETGLICNSLKHIFTLYPTPGYTNEKIYLYEAESAQIGEQQLDEGEFLSVEQIPLDRAYQMIDSGEIKDAKTIVALMYYRNKT